MRHCDKCRVQVRGDASRCPLCQGALSGEAEPALYPRLPSLYRQHSLLFRFLLLLSAAGGIVSVAVNLLLPANGYWCLFVLLGVVCFWIMLFFAIRRLHSVPKNITNQVIVVSLLSLLWDWLTGWRGWSLDYVVPLLCAGAMIALALIAWIKRMPTEDYLGCLLANAALGLMPLLLFLCGLLRMPIPSVICSALGLILLVALSLFMGPSLRAELAKRFHL